MKKWLIAGLVLFGLCGGLGGVIIFVTGVGPYDLPTAARELDGELERSRKLGLPQVQEELERKVPDEDNAALAVHPLLIERSSGTTSKLSTAMKNYANKASGSEAELRTELAAMKGDLDLVVNTRKKGWFVDRDYDQGMNLLFPEYAAAKEICKALSHRAMLAAKDGSVESALADLEACRRLSKWLSDDPTLIGLLVAIAQEAITLRACETVANEWRSKPDALGKLDAMLARSSFPMSLERGLTGEYYFALSTSRNLGGFGGVRALANPDQAPPQDKNWKTVRSGAPKSMPDRAMLASMLKLYNDMFETYNVEGWNKLGAGKMISERASQEMDKNKMSYMLAAILFPVFEQSDIAVARRNTIEEVTRKLVQARLAKARTGRWPKISGADVFAKGAPYLVSTSGDAIRIWSVGPNGTDDGGSTKSTPRHDDIVAASPR